MSIFGAMTTAVSGLSAQAAAFGNISDNIANSQSVGFKAVNTNFVNYLTLSTPTLNESGSVVARPDYSNNVQGAITQSTDPLALAISGQGFFAVSQAAGSTSGNVQNFSTQQYFTRAGDFSLDKNGYLVNGEGQFLDGWPVDSSTNIVNQTALTPIQVTQNTFQPIATSTINLSADLPATPTPGQPITSQVNVYDSVGNLHTVTLNWTQNAANDWTVAVSSPDNTSGSTIGSAEIKFGTTSGNAVSPGTIGSVGNATGAVTTSAFAAGQPADLTFTANFGNGPQSVALSLGNFGTASGLTQYAGSSFNLLGINQNGVPQGNFSNLTISQQGDVVVNYDNGQSRTIAQVPITNFNAPDALQRQNGQAFTASSGSGNPLTNAVGSNGAGTLVVGSTESSNVDIATEFTKLIAAQEAYSANAKVITTADQLTQTTINMKQ